MDEHRDRTEPLTTQGGPDGNALPTRRDFWVKYYSSGKPIRESTGTTKQKEAERFLKNREGRSAAGLQPLPRVDRITYDELARDLRLHYETRARAA